jgi:hypothetical protein
VKSLSNTVREQQGYFTFTSSHDEHMLSLTIAEYQEACRMLVRIATQQCTQQSST